MQRLYPDPVTRWHVPYLCAFNIADKMTPTLRIKFILPSQQMPFHFNRCDLDVLYILSYQTESQAEENAEKKRNHKFSNHKMHFRPSPS